MGKKDFIQIKCRNYFLNDEKFIPKGINLGNWLNIESFMHGLPSVENDMHKQLKDQFDLVHYDTIAAATLATKITIESLALENILIALNKLDEHELLKLAASFQLNKCRLRKEVEEIILKD